MQRDHGDGVIKKLEVEEEKMATVWITLKRSLHNCKPEPSQVHEPKPRSNNKNVGSMLTRKSSRSGCSRSIANLKDVVIHGSKRHTDYQKPSSSPRSIGSSEFLNPITHEVILNNSKCELRITGFGACNETETYVGTLRPGTPYRGGAVGLTPTRKSPGIYAEKEMFGLVGGSPLSSAAFSNGGVVQNVGSTPRNSCETGMQKKRSFGGVTCYKCAEQFAKLDGLEEHHLSKHAVTELVEGDNSRKIVEIICKTSWLKSENNCGRIERVLKVHNMQKTISRFEEYREVVKMKASKLPKKHPRCLADGNELLRFYGTTIACSLGTNGSSGLCKVENCNVCQIIRYGFSTTKELKEGIGVFTTSTSGRAFESTEIYGDNHSTKKALIVCRVIAGRVHKPLDNYQELTIQSGFDSIAGKVGPYANIEELYLLNPRALLPCFVVICKL